MRSPKLFDKPNDFIPERHENSEKIKPFSFVPFSAGPRNCVGQKFAMLEIKTIVANVLRNFELEYCGEFTYELPLVAELILRTKDPLMFKLKERVY